MKKYRFVLLLFLTTIISFAGSYNDLFVSSVDFSTYPGRSFDMEFEHIESFRSDDWSYYWGGHSGVLNFSLQPRNQIGVGFSQRYYGFHNFFFISFGTELVYEGNRSGAFYLVPGMDLGVNFLVLQNIWVKIKLNSRFNSEMSNDEFADLRVQISFLLDQENKNGEYPSINGIPSP